MPTDENKMSESFGPQLFADAEPSDQWGLEELGQFARTQYDHILDGERLLAPAYRRLGQALIFAKKAFRHGKWSQYLKDLGIDKTRASRARAIYQAFADVGDVKELTVDDAYSRRQKKSKAESADSTRLQKEAQRLRHSIAAISKQSQEVIHDAAFAEAAEAKILIPAVRKAIHELQAYSVNWKHKLHP